jgi:hypothetical protein
VKGVMAMMVAMFEIGGNRAKGRRVEESYNLDT